MGVNVVLSGQGVAQDGRCLACRNGFLKRIFALQHWMDVHLESKQTTKPAIKPRRFVSSSSRLVQNLAAQICTHTMHEPLQGKWTRMSAF